MAYDGGSSFEGAGILPHSTARRRVARQIGVVLFDGFSLLKVGIIPEVFQRANAVHGAHATGVALYDIHFFSAEGGSVVSSSSMGIRTQACASSDVAGFDALFIGDGEGALRAAGDEPLLRWLRRVTPASLVVEALGEGRQVLGAARSSSAWRVRDLSAWSESQAGFETVEHYEPARTALMLVKRDLGPQATREIARRLPSLGAAVLVSLFPEGTAATASEKVRSSARWLRENCERPIKVVDAARVASMSERNFLRCFKRETGQTPSGFLLEARLELASRLLAQTDFAIHRIATQSGWGNDDRLARAFQARFKMTLAEYRARARKSLPGIG